MGRPRSTSNTHAWRSKLVLEDWKEWQYQLDVATDACSSKNGALLEIVERMELDDIIGMVALGSVSDCGRRRVISNST